MPIATDDQWQPMPTASSSARCMSRFIDSVLSYRERKGYITEKQYRKLPLAVIGLERGFQGSSARSCSKHSISFQSVAARPSGQGGAKRY